MTWLLFFYSFHLSQILDYQYLLSNRIVSCFFYTAFRRPHVWGQFCLCYAGQKLVLETDYLRNYGIKDGDQVRNFSPFRLTAEVVRPMLVYLDDILLDHMALARPTLLLM